MASTANGPDQRRIAVYVRVSTEDQANKADGSLENQTHRCKQYLLGTGYSSAIVDAARVYREEGFSGKDTNRPELQRLLKDVRADRIGTLVFTELSRISRSLSDFLALHEILDHHGVKFISLKENFDTSSNHGNLIVRILVMLYEFERRTTAERTKLAMRDRAERGLYNGGAIPLGYLPDPDRPGHLRPIEPEATLVREAFKLYLESGALSKTARILAERGYTRAEYISRRGKMRKCTQVSGNALGHVLQNPTYVGLKEVNRDKRNMADGDALALPESDRYRLVPAVWEPLIDVETFEKVQELVAENRSRWHNSVAPKDYDYVLHGVIKCGTCGSRLEGASAKYQKYHTYRHLKGTHRPECGRVSHPAEVIEQAVIERLRMLADDKPLLDDIIEKANQRMDDTSPERERDLAGARGRLAQLQAGHANFIANLMTAPPGTVPSTFWTKAKEMEESIRQTESEIHRIEDEIADLRASRLKATDFRAALRTFTQVYGEMDAFQRSKLLAYVLDRVEVTDTHITVVLWGQAPAVAELRSLTEAGGRYSERWKWLPNRPGEATALSGGRRGGST